MPLRQREKIQKMLREVSIKYIMTKKIFFCVLSAVLLVLSFPKTSLSLLAFGALVPLFIALDGEKAKRSFALAYLCGVAFFTLMFFWFIFVTKLGAVLIVLFLALYFGLFGLGVCWLSKKNFLAQIFLIPALWVVLEYLRAHLLTGFGWALLGHSQYQNLWLIQIADITGVYGVSFLVVMVNVVLHGAVFAKQKPPLKQIALSFILVAILFTASVAYSAFILSRKVDGIKARIGVAQGNVALVRHWNPREKPYILRDYFALSQKLADEKADLIIWPESSYPGEADDNPTSLEVLKNSIARLKTPHLIGMVTKANGDYFNSATFFSSSGEAVGQYNKLHLVPFGEYIPLRSRLPFLASIVPIDDFRAGEQYTIFKTPQGAFSALICFEDTVPELARGFVARGAELLVNISNDAWFHDTKEPYLHLASAVFRSIENRRYLVRSGNVGISCFVGPTGRILSSVEASGKKTYRSGARAEDVSFIKEKTFYAKIGELFAYFCISVILINVIIDFYRRRKQS